MMLHHICKSQPTIKKKIFSTPGEEFDPADRFLITEPAPESVNMNYCISNMLFLIQHTQERRMPAFSRLYLIARLSLSEP